MKLSKIYRLLPFIAMLSVPILFIFSKSVSTADETDSNNDSALINDTIVAEPGRASITFILGEDRPEAKPYYSLAYDYYRTDKSARTEYIITTCRSLTEVRDYLCGHPPVNGRPWGLINLITHGNAWFGMSVSVTPGSLRSTPERIMEFVKDGRFDTVPDYLLDESTEIILHGCGLGKDRKLLEIVSFAFGGKDRNPIVSASRLNEYYSSIRTTDKVMQSQLFYAETWNTYYKLKQRPTDSTLINELNTYYPNAGIDWCLALSRYSPPSASDIFHYTINVPVYYMVQYNKESSLPDLSTEKKKEQWVMRQKGLVKIINKSKIPADRFLWCTVRIMVKDAQGNDKPAIHVTGWCTILCVVRPLIVEKDAKEGKITPYFPANSDTRYFGIYQKSNTGSAATGTQSVIVTRRING